MHEFFTLCIVFMKVISLIYEKIYFGDRVPLSIFAREGKTLLVQQGNFSFFLVRGEKFLYKGEMFTLPHLS